MSATKKNRWLIWGIVGGAAVIAIPLLALLVAYGAQARPIDNVEIVVTAPTASKNLLHDVNKTTRPFLNRRLRDAGYDDPGVGQFTARVHYEKIGSTAYESLGHTVESPTIQVTVTLIDADGRERFQIKGQSEPRHQERLEARSPKAMATEFNRIGHNRAMSDILDMTFPHPDDLPTERGS